MSFNVISFKTFETTDEFEKWQEENEPIIISAIPVLNDLGADINGCSFTADMRFGIFVQFIKQ